MRSNIKICNECGIHYNSKTVDECPKCKQERVIVEKDGITLLEIANKIGVTKERIRQIELEALKKLNTPLIRKLLN